MKFSEKINKIIYELDDKFINESVAFETARHGNISNFQVVNYLFNLQKLFSMAEICLLNGVDSSKEKHPEITDMFQQKYQEEIGHHHWAEDDVKNFGYSNNDQLYITKEMTELCDHIRDLSENSPLTYLAYTTLAEYITVVTGPKWIHLLKERCNIDVSKMSAVNKHIELDQDHVADELVMWDSLTLSHADQDGVLEEIKYSGNLLYNFIESITYMEKRNEYNRSEVSRSI